MNDSARMWLPAHTLNCYEGDPLLRSWLTERALLTERMRRECGAAFRLQVVDESRTPAGFVRCIELLVDERPWIYAETTVPADTLRQHDWLRRLGTRPLGEWLRDRPDVTREDLEFCRVYDDDAQVARALSRAQIGSQPLWVRRARFAVAAAPFVLHELYFPYIGLRSVASQAAAS
jgi:chorismate--pyruvate lyase